MLTNSDHADEGATDQLAAGKPQQIPQGRPSLTGCRVRYCRKVQGLGTLGLMLCSSCPLPPTGVGQGVTTGTSRRRATRRGSPVTGQGQTAALSLQGGGAERAPGDCCLQPPGKEDFAAYA